MGDARPAAAVSSPACELRREFVPGLSPNTSRAFANSTFPQCLAEEVCNTAEVHSLAGGSSARTSGHDTGVYWHLHLLPPLTVL